MKQICLPLLLLPMLLMAQENPLDVFKPLENYIWHAEGKWSDGSDFKQEINFEFSLSDNIVKVESFGYINKEQTEFGLRNHGIRHYDKDTKKIHFWEFDIFGSLTKGIVTGEEKNLIYKYNYNGTEVTEMWVYRDKKTYQFIVGIYENGNWKQKFLQTEFNGKSK